MRKHRRSTWTPAFPSVSQKESKLFPRIPSCYCFIQQDKWLCTLCKCTLLWPSGNHEIRLVEKYYFYKFKIFRIFFSRLFFIIIVLDQKYFPKLHPLRYIEVRDQVEIWWPHFWPYFLNYTFFKKIFHSECNPRDT